MSSKFGAMKGNASAITGAPRPGRDMSEGDAIVDWATIVSSLVHPTKIIILEAMLRLDRPISASELEKMSCGKPTLSAFSFHLKQLAKAEVLKVIGKLKIRKAQGNKKETFFYFAGKSDWMPRPPHSPDVDDPLATLALASTTQRASPHVGAG